MSQHTVRYDRMIGNMQRELAKALRSPDVLAELPPDVKRQHLALAAIAVQEAVQERATAMLRPEDFSGRAEQNIRKKDAELAGKLFDPPGEAPLVRIIVQHATMPTAECAEADEIETINAVLQRYREKLLKDQHAELNDRTTRAQGTAIYGALHDMLAEGFRRSVEKGAGPERA